MSDWRTDQLPEATFRGVPFGWLDVGGQYGRRLAIHEYPLSEQWDVEDLGRAMRRHSVDCQLIGDNYMDQLKALIAAVEQPGPGLLIHPTLGPMTVHAERVSTRERHTERGTATLPINFIEVDPAQLPAVSIDTARALIDAADAAAGPVISVGEDITTTGPEFQRSALATQVGQFVDALAVDVNDIAQAINTAPGFGTLQESVGLAVDVATAVQDLVDAPRRIAAMTVGVLLNRVATLEGLAQWFDYAVDYYAARFMTPTNLRIAANQEALQLMVRSSAVMAGARIVAGTDYASSDDAIADRDALLTAIERVQAVADDDLFAAMQTLRVALVDDIEARAASLARLATYTPSRTEPATVIAYRLYGDADRDAEIVARNRITHPAFVPGGVALEVRSV